MILLSKRLCAKLLYSSWNDWYFKHSCLEIDDCCSELDKSCCIFKNFSRNFNSSSCVFNNCSFDFDNSSLEISISLRYDSLSDFNFEFSSVRFFISFLWFSILSLYLIELWLNFFAGCSAALSSSVDVGLIFAHKRLLTIFKDKLFCWFVFSSAFLPLVEN